MYDHRTKDLLYSRELIYLLTYILTHSVVTAADVFLGIYYHHVVALVELATYCDSLTSPSMQRSSA